LQPSRASVVRMWSQRCVQSFATSSKSAFQIYQFNRAFWDWAAPRVGIVLIPSAVHPGDFDYRENHAASENRKHKSAEEKYVGV